MIKIMLKEPICSGLQSTPGGGQPSMLVDKMANYLLVEGYIDEKYIKGLLEVVEAGWLECREPSGNSVLVPINNIAYLQEQK